MFVDSKDYYIVNQIGFTFETEAVAYTRSFVFPKDFHFQACL